MPTLRRLSLLVSALAFVVVVLGLLTGHSTLWQPAACLAVVTFAFGLGASEALRGFQYTAWIIAAVTAAMLYPTAFQQWGPVELRNKWVMLFAIQMVMFGMGTQMSTRDFVGVMKMPWGVFVAVACQFLVMPLSGYALTKIFPLPNEVAAGVILIGACSSGLASNVMCYIAKANLALSITATACTTLLAPLMTPLWMKVLAGELVQVRFTSMMVEIVKMVIVPIAAALLHDALTLASPATRRRWQGITALATVATFGIVYLFRSGLLVHTAPALQLTLELTAFAFGAIVAGFTYHRLVNWQPLVVRFMPLFSMIGIVYVTTIITAAGRDQLLQIGGLLFLVAVLHNSAGYFFGYWLARLARLDTASCRTVAIEVGLQNGGMASGLAGSMGKLATMGLAAAVFSPWMNISGSLLANFWRKRPTDTSPVP